MTDDSYQRVYGAKPSGTAKNIDRLLNFFLRDHFTVLIDLHPTIVGRAHTGSLRALPPDPTQVLVVGGG